jgi:hypothetical protein
MNNNQDPFFNQLDLSDLVIYLFKQWRIFAFSIGACFIIFSLIALNLTKTWSSDALLVEASSSSGGTNSSTSDLLADLTGVNLASGQSDVLRTVKRKLRTKDFFASLIEDEEFLIEIVAVSGYDEKTAATLYDPTIYDTIKSTWVSKPSFFNSFDAYLSIVSAGFLDETTGDFFVIKAEHKSPESAKYIVQKLILQLNELQRQEDIVSADNMLEYLQDELIKTNQISIQQAINGLIDNQIKTKTFANVKAEYVIKTIDSPYIPERRTSPRRGFFVISATFIVQILLAIFLAAKLIYSKSNFKLSNL